MRQIVFVLPLVNGPKLLWTVAGPVGLKCPVVEYAEGRYRIVNSKEDNLKLLDVLDAIMAERRVGAYPHEGATKTTPRGMQMEVDMDATDGEWLPMQFGEIAFCEHGMDTVYYQKCIDSARRSLANK